VVTGHRRLTDSVDLRRARPLIGLHRFAINTDFEEQLSMRSNVGYLRTACVSVAVLFGHCGCSPAMPAKEAAPAATDRWEISVSRDATIVIKDRGARVVEAGYLFWGPNWKYAYSTIEVVKSANGSSRFSGAVPDLGLKVVGEIENPSPRVLRFTYQIETTKSMDGIQGGCLEWRCKLDSPVLRRRSAEPDLLNGNIGWKWSISPEQDLTVRFDRPIESVAFERGQKSTIRTWFVGSRLTPGKSSFSMTVELPPGGNVTPSPEERYGAADTATWYRNALRSDASPVDLRGLNAEDRPAGHRGFVKVSGDQLLFGDGSPARFWGGNLAAYALFVDKKEIQVQARRIARLGYNLMRIHHHDSTRWVSPTLIAAGVQDSRHWDRAALDKLDWWIKCLKDEGIYVWLDLHVGRQFLSGDGISEGFDEIARAGNEGKGFNYLNSRVAELMREFNAAYLGHVNPYTKLAYKDDPVVMGLLITNENDMTGHGHFALPDKNNPVHSAIFMKAARDFASSSGLSADQTWRTWEAGPSKIFLNDLEHRFNQIMLPHLQSIGVKVPVATTNYWGDDALYSLPALTDGAVIDAHSYGVAEALSVNARYEANYLSWIAAAQVSGKPLTVTEWNVPFPATDRFTAPLYVSSIASLQGWDAPMIYNYSQGGFRDRARPDEWSTFEDVALTGMMPAASVMFRRGHVKPANETYCLDLSRARLFEQWSPMNSATIRTLAERSKLVIGLPDTKELTWDRRVEGPRSAKIVTDPDQDFLPIDVDFVESDTGEIRRDWAQGVQTINTPKTQAVQGWVGGQSVNLSDVGFRLVTKKAAVAVTSLDDRPITSSRRILITAIARVVASPGGAMPLLSEPVVGEITIHLQTKGLGLVSLAADGRETEEPLIAAKGGGVTIRLPSAHGTHWFLLKAQRSAEK
jgi:hypothetical protein